VPSGDDDLAPLREILRKLDEVSKAAVELRERVRREMTEHRAGEKPAADDTAVIRARGAARAARKR
jgi:hypothetical protein